MFQSRFVAFPTVNWEAIVFQGYLLFGSLMCDEDLKQTTLWSDGGYRARWILCGRKALLPDYGWLWRWQYAADAGSHEDYMVMEGFFMTVYLLLIQTDSIFLFPHTSDSMPMDGWSKLVVVDEGYAVGCLVERWMV